MTLASLRKSVVDEHADVKKIFGSDNG